MLPNMGKHKKRRDRSRSRSPKRRRHRSREDSREGGQSQFDFERHKSKLIKIFFRDEDIIPYGSDEYKDFWKFLFKYQSFQRRQKSSSSSDHIPYKKRLTQSLKLRPNDPHELLARIPFQDDEYYDRRSILTEEAVSEFQNILALYIDFLQKEKFAKLRKLREAQANLPIAEFRQNILETLEQNQVVIVAGDTGCGKSTQVPQYLLQAGYTKIACTQPRRIACISLAKRVGYETLNEYGTEIGYQIRFEKQKSAKTRVLFLTEGLLLRQVSTDPSLSTYDVVVLDEVHERHLHADYLLGIVKCLVQQRSDLKVILMSATINIKLFQDYFDGDAPVIQVPGRLYPIKLNYMPIPALEQSSTSDKLNPAPYVRILQLIDKTVPKNERGDVLIFLSGIKEITTIVDAANEYAERTGSWIVLALHSTLSLADQDKVFDYSPEGVRKCIVGTNIAETSITIDGVRFVVDSGKVKEMQYDPVCKMQRLKEFWISRASAEQRKGRAGRTGPGVCYRMFAEEEYKALAPYSTPEIQRVPLDSLVLQMTSMGLPDVRKFPFIEPPPIESIEESVLVLKAQNALAEDESLTVTGQMLANLPVDVSIGKMLLMGTLFHQVEAVLSLAAALSVQSPFTNNAYRDADCVAARRNLDSDHGDPITLLNSFREWLEIKATDRESSRKWCKKRGLEEQRFYEMTKLRQQFRDLLEDSGLLKKDVKSMSSSERTKRHGELKKLKDLKKEFQKAEGPKKKKMLKMKDSFLGMEEAMKEAEDAEEGKVDLKDIEFRMRNDVAKVLKTSKQYSYRDLTILKLIMASGLYPQVAVADEFNSAKNGADQLFHTRVKPFNLLHPNGIFATNSEYLQLDSVDIVGGNNARHPLSAKHQVLIYLSLLETNKPYLINTLRMPALQTLLLFAKTIETNVDFSRLVFDAWLELNCPRLEQAQNAILTASKLRSMWQDLLRMKLLDEDDDEDKQLKLEAKLSAGLMNFIHTEVVFSVKRLLPGDLKVMYYGLDRGLDVEVDENPFGDQEEVRPNETKGGLMLNDYLTYNCLENTGDQLLATCIKYECDICEESLYSSHLDRILHVKKCLDRQEAIKDEEADLVERKANPNAQAYHCSNCDKTMYLTTTEILRHKRSHQD